MQYFDYATREEAQKAADKLREAGWRAFVATLGVDRYQVRAEAPPTEDIEDADDRPVP